MKVLVLSLLFFVSSVFAQNVINISALKDTTVKADEMIVQILIEKNDTSSNKANEISHSSYINVLNALKKYGYKDNDIYLIRSNFTDNNYRQKGYFASQVYEIVLTRFDLFDQLKKDLLSVGATGVNISNFWTTDYDKIKKELYIEAIAQAQEKAKFICSKIGAKSYSIGNIVDNSREQSINGDLSYENAATVSAQNEMNYSELGPPSVQPSITNGRISINVFLHITFNYNYTVQQNTF